MSKKEQVTQATEGEVIEKRPVGIPPFYKTPGELQEKIDEYFSGACQRVKRIVGNKKDGYTEIEVPKPTITDLVLFLGFADRSSFYDYEKKKDFTYTIKRARSFIEREYENMLDINPTGAIFALKNFGWTDRQEVDHTSGGEKIQPFGIAQLIRESKQDERKQIEAKAESD